MTADEIRPAVAADRAPILAIMRSVLGWPDDERAEHLWSWKHEQNPFGASPVWVGLHDEEVVAVRAFMRWELAAPRGDVFARSTRWTPQRTPPSREGDGSVG